MWCFIAAATGNNYGFPNTQALRVTLLREAGVSLGTAWVLWGWTDPARSLASTEDMRGPSKRLGS